jgi:hypothetical protein
LTIKQGTFIATLVYFTGVAWLLLNVVWQTNIVICPLRSATGLPCPACGTTRAMRHLLQGEMWNAFITNPNVSIVAPASIAFTLALIGGWWSKKPLTQRLYATAQATLNRKHVFAAFILWELGVWVYLLLVHFT